MKRTLFLLSVVLCGLSVPDVHADVWAYSWVQFDEYGEEIDVYGETMIDGSYLEQFYYDFA